MCLRQLYDLVAEWVAHHSGVAKGARLPQTYWQSKSRILQLSDHPLSASEAWLKSRRFRAFPCVLEYIGASILHRAINWIAPRFALCQDTRALPINRHDAENNKCFYCNISLRLKCKVGSEQNVAECILCLKRPCFRRFSNMHAEMRARQACVSARRRTHFSYALSGKDLERNSSAHEYSRCDEAGKGRCPSKKELEIHSP